MGYVDGDHLVAKAGGIELLTERRSDAHVRLELDDHVGSALDEDVGVGQRNLRVVLVVEHDQFSARLGGSRFQVRR